VCGYDTWMNLIQNKIIIPQILLVTGF
jgi:hypothetical protein